MKKKADQKEDARSPVRRPLPVEAEGSVRPTTSLTAWAQDAFSPVFDVAHICHSFVLKNILEPGRRRGYVAGGVRGRGCRDGGRAPLPCLSLSPQRHGIKMKDMLGAGGKGAFIYSHQSRTNEQI